MEIKWLGHACFKIISGSKSVVLDPFKDGSVPGFNNIREKADEVYCSHLHGDHGAIECVEVNHQPPFEVEIIDTYHDDKQGSLRGTNKIHIFTVENLKVVHFGDLGCALTNEQIEKLEGVDVVMIPVGGHYTIDAKGAYEVVQNIHPNIVIPMHYSGKGFGFDVISGVENFTSYFTNVEKLDGPTWQYEKLEVPSVVVFQY